MDYRFSFGIDRIWNTRLMEAYSEDNRGEDRKLSDELCTGSFISYRNCWDDRSCINSLTSSIDNTRHEFECCRNDGRGTWMEKGGRSSNDETYPSCLGSYYADDDADRGFDLLYMFQTLFLKKFPDNSGNFYKEDADF